MFDFIFVTGHFPRLFIYSTCMKYCYEYLISYRSSQSTNYSEISSQDPLADSAVYWQDDKVVDMGSPDPRTVRFIPKREPGIHLGRLTRYTYSL